MSGATVRAKKQKAAYMSGAGGVELITASQLAETAPGQEESTPTGPMHSPEREGTKHCSLIDDGACCDSVVKQGHDAVHQADLPAHSDCFATFAVAWGAEAKLEPLPHVLL